VWQNVNDSYQQAYLSNAYRVLMTRARQGMVIYVPCGCDADPTRMVQLYEGIFLFLKRCGLETIVAAAV
jgi:hypothetical protein